MPATWPRGTENHPMRDRPRDLFRGLYLLVAICAPWSVPAACVDAAEPVDFARQIRPILADHCLACHGPDEAARKAGLRLDQRAAATASTPQGVIAIVPANVDASELVRRIGSADQDLLMPPPSAKKPLSEGQRILLRQWIEQGAAYDEHWAFVAPRRPPVPSVTRADGSTHPIDAFVSRQLEQAGLSPATPADRATWLRRVSLDLCGLPPTLDELAEFLADESPQARERVVDRLLASPRYAERMAMNWLDAARYADTNGYNNDETRTMWPWRDWVIRAYATGMPYDQFITEQLAGDMLPNPTLAQRVATGFNRNHVLTTEGGIIEEEYHVEYVADRVHATATTFLGLSMQCARCHDHKYDPITQREYYQFAAFFDNVPDKIVGYSQGKMAEPLLRVPSPAQQAELDRLARLTAELGGWLRDREANADADVAAWERQLTPQQVAALRQGGLVAHFTLDESAGDEVANAIDASRPAKIQGTVTRVEGKSGGALEFDGQSHIDAGDVGGFEADQAFSIAAWIFPTSAEPATIVSRMDEADANRGYDVILEAGKVASHFVHHWPDDGFKVIDHDPLSLQEWHHVLVTYDGTRRTSGVTLYVDGQPRFLDVVSGEKIQGTLKTAQPLHVGRRQSSAGFRGRLDDVQIHDVTLTREDASRLMAGQPAQSLAELLDLPDAERTDIQRAALRTYFLCHVDADYQQRQSELADLPRQLAEVEKSIPMTMVMQEVEPRRATHILVRGKYDQPAEEVQPGVPGALGALAAGATVDRLALARWLTSPSHPLTARVAVNRWWEMLFGAGLVETVEDFGVQGTPPSHPDLLDWLACELVESGWNQRAILKCIVMSATYSQSSRTTRELRERDPRNRLLSRGPRARLPAETVRDNALFVSGLLTRRIGGSSVKPYQPDGLWEDVSVERREKYLPDVGEGLYRRSMYTFWKRTCPPPGMSLFDAPDRETCVVRRSRTNTPLQALALLNDPTFVEASRKLAERVVLLATGDEERLTRAYLLCLSRPPRDEERKAVAAVMLAARERFTRNPADADKLLAVGASARGEGLAPVELATWAVVASVLLNLEETITKP